MSKREGNAPPVGQATTPGGRPFAKLAQVAWVILFGLATILFLDCLRAAWIGQPTTFAADVEIAPRAYAIYRLILDVSLYLSFAIVGALIFWRMADKWFGLVITLAPLLLLTRIIPSINFPSSVQPVFQSLNLFLGFFGASLLALALALFPDGRFVPRWTRFYVLFVITYAYELFYLDGVIRRQFGTFLFQLMLDAGLVAIGVAAQVYRYRRVSTVEARQQTRWVLFGLTIGFVGIYSYATLTVLVPGLNEFSRQGVYFQMIGQLLAYLALLTVPVTLAVAVSRYRLWDIDLVIRRTLVYSTLTSLLALIYFVAVVLLQLLFGVTWLNVGRGSGEQSNAAVVLSTLLIAALFTPMRRRLQNVIDRRFYRHKYNAAQALARFAAVTRSEVDPDRLATELLQVIQDTMQPTSVYLWLSKR